MATQRVYICPDHPDKPYTSWRKFRGHWSTQHRGQECPPREEFQQEMEKEEITLQKIETDHAGGTGKARKQELPGPGVVRPEEFTLPEEPVPRLAKILEVNGVPEEFIRQVLGVFQLHPAYRDNPTNLHYLLTAKLPRKFHPSIPLMTSAFMSSDASYPEGIPIMGGFGMQSGGMMPPFGSMGGYSPYGPPVYGYPYNIRQPMGRQREEDEEDRPRRREGPVESMKETIALMGAMFEVIGKVGGGGEDKFEKFTDKLEAAYNGLSETIEEVLTKSQEEKTQLREEFNKKIEGVTEESRKVVEATKEALHQTEMGRLEDKITTLQEAKDEERSEGLGTLLKEAGEGLGTQVEGLRTSVTQGVDKLGTIAEKLVSTEGLPKLSIGERGKGTAQTRTVASASELLSVETEIEELAKSLEGGKS